MRALFLRIYLSVAAVVLGGLALAALWGRARQLPPERWTALVTEAPVEVRAAFAHDSDPAALERLRTALDADVEVVPPGELPPPVRDRLGVGFPVLPGPGMPPDLFVPLDDGRAVRVRPRHLPSPLLPPIAVGAVVLALGVVVAALLRPLDRELARLSGAAVRLGQGDLSARASLGSRAALAGIGVRFDEMADRVGALVAARQDLLLAVSHELRHPLQRLRFSVDLLVGADEAERARLADGLQRDLDALDRLVEELLTWGRLDQPRLTVEAVALGPVLVRAGAEASRLGKPVRVEVGEIEVRADPALLRRAVDNLLANAVRHARSSVTLSASASRIAVDDDGPGLPAADRERVLEPFVRVGDHAGAGLGLALVDRIARAHGWRVAIGDSPLGGARVELVFPDER